MLLPAARAENSPTDSEILFGVKETPKDQVDTQEEVNRAETVLLPPTSVKDKQRLQTRRQSKGLIYFDRLKPRVQIDIGTLEDWYRARYIERPAKRRRLNRTVGEIEREEDGEDEDEDDEVELNRTMEAGGLVNKSMLYDEWYKDFQE